MDRTYQAGGSITGGAYAVKSVTATQQGLLPGKGKSFVARLRLQHTKQVIRGSGDKKLDGVYRAGISRVQMIVVHSAGGWNVAQWSLA